MTGAAGRGSRAPGPHAGPTDPHEPRRTGAPLLALDTATTIAVVALGDADGRLLRAASWPAGHRHGEELLTRIDALLDAGGIGLADLAGIVVGTGPGAFTGLRVGLATAKGLAHGLNIPIVGVATSAALLAASTDDGPRSPTDDDGATVLQALLLPAGPSDRVLVAGGSATLLPGGSEPRLEPGTILTALDLADRAPSDALALGERARAGLASALVRLGAARLARGTSDDLARLVPEYVTLPRGVRAETGTVEWSRDRR